MLQALRLLLMPALAHTATAQVTFTVTATANNSFVGYTSGNSYTFTFTTTALGTPNTWDSFSSTDSSWYDGVQPGDNRIWSTVSGDFNGTFSYANVAFNNTDEVAVVSTSYSAPFASLNLFVGSVTDMAGDIGLKTLDNTAIGEISVTLSSNNGSLPSFTQPAAFTDLTTYFSAYTGTYSPNSSASLRLGNAIQNSHSTLLFFTVTSVQITAVPEPATYAVFLGIAALGCGARRRRFTRT